MSNLDNIDRELAVWKETQDAEVRNMAYIKALKNADRQMDAAAEIMLEHGDAKGAIANDELFKTYRQHVDSANYYERQAAGIKKMHKRHVKTAKTLKVREARTYSPLRPEHSWFLDLANTAVDPATLYGTQRQNYDESKARLARYGQELAAEMRSGSAEGRYARKCVRENFRSHGQPDGRTAAQVTIEHEQRAASSGTAGSLVTPIYLTEDTALYRSPVSAFLDESNDQPLPPYGLEVFVPAWETGTSVGAQGSENTGIDSSVPTANYLSNTLTTFAGTVPVSQQLFDRAGPTAFDTLCIAQLREQLDAAVDAYVIATAIATAETVTESTTLTIPLLYGNLSTAREQMSDAPGVRLKASHVFANADLLEWVFKQTDQDNRPIIVPDPATLIALPPKGEPTIDSTFTGVFLNRQGLWEDDSIPAFTGQPTWAQLLVADMSKVLTWRSTAVPRAIVGQGAADLTVDVQLYQYVTAIVTYPEAVQVISGSGYANLS